MLKPHKEILTKEQADLLDLVRLFSKDFGLVGGTVCNQRDIIALGKK